MNLLYTHLPLASSIVHALPSASARSSEFELVTQALWVDPKDQSGWLYHRWLINDGSDVQTLIEQIEMIKELLEVEEDAKCEARMAAIDKLGIWC